MYLIYTTIYYVITILSTAASYVLISANLDDFKSIASRFIPDEFAGVADVILERAKDAFINDHIQNRAMFHHKNTRIISAAKSLNTNDTQKSNIKPTAKHTLKNVTKESPLHFKIDLDEFVENIKRKLHSELIKLAPIIENKKNNKTNVKFKRIRNGTSLRNSGFHVLMKPKGISAKKHTTRSNTRKQKTNITQEQHKKKRPIDKRYLADVFVGKPPKHILGYGKPVSGVAPKKSNNTTTGVGVKNRKPYIVRQKSKYLEVFTNKQQNNKNVKIARNNAEEENKAPFKLNSKYLDTATESTQTSRVTDLFVGYDLLNTNDSYEDYVTPKRDADYKEPFVETSTIQPEGELKTLNALREGPIIQNTKVIDVFSDLDKLPIKAEDGVHYEDDTLNNPDVTMKNNLYESVIHPYVEQFEAEINNMNAELGETTEASTEKPIFWNVKTTEKIKKAKSKAATLIPKRDFYKISSPNYLLDVPIIGEKYHFDEPIPEEDRVPENLKYIGNPPASINGKVVFSA